MFFITSRTIIFPVKARSMVDRNRIFEFVDSRSDIIAKMTSEFIRTQSPSGSEAAVAGVLKDALKNVGIEATTDAAGNVIGLMKGTSQIPGKRLAFNVHLDHVPAGSMDCWEKDPFSGEISDGKVWGRGASDTKGAWAPMIVAMEAVKKNGGVQGDVLFTGVVMEELSYCIGMKTLLDSTLKDARPDYIVSGEATSLNIAVGHRGRTELELSTGGKSCHASTPWRGENALYKAGRVITGIEKLSRSMVPLPGDAMLGKSTLALTDIECMPGVHNMVPELCKIYLDYRFLPTETQATIIARIKKRLDDDYVTAKISTCEYSEKTYTGLEFKGQKYMPAYLMQQEHPLVKEAQAAVSDAISMQPKIQRWDFATDGGYSMGVLGIPTIGFSPCEEQLAHTPNEYVRTDYMVKAAKVYAELILRLCGTN